MGFKTSLCFSENGTDRASKIRIRGVDAKAKPGLLYFHPTQVSQDKIDWLSFNSEIKFIDIEKSDEVFLSFIDETLTILESSDPPASNPECIWCNFLSSGKQHIAIE